MQNQVPAEQIQNLFQAAGNQIQDAFANQQAFYSTNQKNAILGCLIAPVFLYFGISWIKGSSFTKLTEESSKAIVEVIPSSDQIAEIVRNELAKREALVRPVVVSLTASQFSLVVFSGLAVGCLIYLVINKNNKTTNTVSTSKY